METLLTMKIRVFCFFELTILYWDIGNKLSKKTSREGWGSKVVEHLATDLGEAFPGVAGFSKRNFELMRQFAESYPNGIC